MAAIIELTHPRPTGVGTSPGPPRPTPVPRPFLAGPTRLRAHTGILVMVLLVVVVALGSTIRSGSVTSSAPTASGELYVVAPGDTLWSIAAELDPEADRGQLVESLVQLNHGDPAVVPGDVVALPELDR